MRIVPKNVKGGLLGFSTSIQVQNTKNKLKGDPLNALKNKKTLKGGPFWVLHFNVEAFGCVQNQVLITFGESESFTKSGTYATSEKYDEKKEIKK